MSIKNRLLQKSGKVFDKVEQFWENQNTTRVIASGMIVVFILMLIFIQLNKWGLLPQRLGTIVGLNHFYAIEIVFTLLLIFEIVSLITNLSKSVAISMAKQFEIFSLILVRKAFKEIGHLDEPIVWAKAIEPLMKSIMDTSSAILIFAGIVVFKNIAKHRPITEDKEMLLRFNLSKKAVSLILFVIFSSLGIYDLVVWLFWGIRFDFFNSFYMLLIFSDILIVIISLRYSHKYLILFRNSGFAVATVLIRLALSAPVYYNSALGISAMIIVLSLSYLYNRFAEIEKFEL
jgi:hypothetical protein